MDTMKGMLLLLGTLALLSLSGVSAQDAAATVPPTYQCYNHSCTSPDMDCLSKSILHHLVEVPTCNAGSGFCKVTRATMEGMHTIVAECSKEDCELTEAYCPINGDVVYNCCNTQFCNTELILGSLPSSAASYLFPAPLALTLAAYLGYNM